MKEIFCGIVASISTALIYLLGGFDIAIQAVIIAVILDYITGVVKAFVTKELSSTIGFKGIVKKVSILFVIMVAVLIDRVTGESGAIRTLVIYYFVANESLSIIENLGKAGVPIPQVIRDSLQALKEKGNRKKVTKKTQKKSTKKGK